MMEGGVNESDIQKIIEMVMKRPPAIDFKADFTIDGRFVPKLLADYILEQMKFKTLEGSGDIYFYEDGYYKSTGKEKIETLCVELLKEKYKMCHKNETMAYIKGSTYINPNTVDNEWVNLENGLLNPLTREFKKHTPDIFNIVRVPIIYDTEADCPLFRAELKKRLEPDIIDTVQEIFGYCYLSGQLFQRAFLLYGPRRTMKSTVLYLLGEMLGDENTTAATLQRLNEDNFSTAYQYGIMANIHADLSSRYLRKTETFMTLTGGDKMTAAKKGGHEFTFFPSSKQIFSCNHIPPTTNKDLAFYRRWIILPFLNQINMEDVDEHMKEKLKNEMPGILNWALDGLERLLKNSKFTHQLTDEEMKDFWEKYSDSIQSFIFNNINMEDDLGVVKKRIIYKEYEDYCKKNDLKIENQIFFGREFKALTGCGTCQQEKIPAYKGVSLINVVEEEVENIISKFIDEGDYDD